MAAAAQLALDANGICTRIGAALGGIGGAPVRVTATTALVGQLLESATVARAVAGIDGEIAPEDDPHVSAAYRRRVARTLLARAILEARDDAQGRASATQ